MQSKFLSIPYRGHGTFTWLCPILTRGLYIVYTYGTVNNLIGKGATARAFYTFLEIAWVAGGRSMGTPVPPQLFPEYRVHSLLPYPIAEMLGGCCCSGLCLSSMYSPNFCRAATEAVLEITLNNSPIWFSQQHLPPEPTGVTVSSCFSGMLAVFSSCWCTLHLSVSRSGNGLHSDRYISWIP